MKKSDSNYGLFEAKPRVFLGIGEILIALILIGASILLQYYQGDNWWVNLGDGGSDNYCFDSRRCCRLGIAF